MLLRGACFAAVHPVPLDKNTRLEEVPRVPRRQDQGQVRSFGDGDGLPELPRNPREQRRHARQADHRHAPRSLCLTCHADKNAADIKGTVHPPAVRDCLTCHDPHSSDNKNQLLKPASGDEKENLCLTCHTTGLNVPTKGSRHAALDMGCDTCHVTHKTGPEPTQENRFHLTKAAPALCLDCHDAKDADLQKAHKNQPFATANCVECHDPHQSDHAEADGEVSACAVSGERLRHLPRAGQGRQGGADADRCQVALRHLPRRQGQADRNGQGAASRRGRRLHRLPQSPRQQPAGLAEDRLP